MKKSNGLAVFVFIPILICIIFLVYNAYNRAPKDISNTKPDVTIHADSLTFAYENDEDLANKNYLGKLILVNGQVVELINQKDTLLNVIIGKNESVSKVSCLLNKNQIKNYKKLNLGQQVYVKGICTGYLSDVELNRAVILDPLNK